MRVQDIRRLHLKKHREESGLFLVEGETSVLEALADGVRHGYEALCLLASDGFVQKHGALIRAVETHVTSAEGLTRAGSLESNGAAILVMRRPAETPANDLIDLAHASGNWLIALDRISDPGNMGALIRIADWYGVAGLLLSPGCVDRFNPKTVSASKGSFLRVQQASGDLGPLLAQARRRGLAVHAATLDGASVHDMERIRPGILLMGSETHGIDPQLIAPGDGRVTIPRLGDAQSLNVAVAAGILLDNFRRLQRAEA